MLARVLPGETASVTFNVTGPGSEAELVATAEEGAAITVVEIQTFETVRIPYTEEELAEFPHAMRERRRREGRLEPRLLATVNSGGPVAVPEAGTAQVRVEITPRTNNVGNAAGQVVFQGAQWGRLAVPVAVLVGSGATEVTALPATISVAIAPGEVQERRVIVYRAPVGATVIAVLDTASPHIRFKSAVASRYERHDYTEEELREVPFAIRERARREGYVEIVESGRAGEGEPLLVPHQGMLQVALELSAPAVASSAPFSGKLSIESTTWRRIDVPIAPVTGLIAITLSTDVVVAAQGTTAAGPTVQLQSHSGPATEVAWALTYPTDPWVLTPSGTTLAAGEHAEVPLTLQVSPGAPVGSHQLSLDATWFDGLGKKRFNFRLDVLPGAMTLVVRQHRIAGQQGGQMSCIVDMTMQSQKFVRFNGGLLPPGVSMRMPGRVVFNPGSHSLAIDFDIDPFAPPSPDHRMTVSWHTEDNVHGGTLDLRVAITLFPREKLFSQPVITPSGVGLGGRADLLLRNDGSGRFRGQMRATGALSYDFQLRTALRSFNSRVLAIGQKSGSVHGALDFGSSKFDWDEPIDAHFATRDWQEIENAQMVVKRSSEIGGFFGTVFDTLVDVVQFVAGGALLAPVIPGAQALAAIIFVGSELQETVGLQVQGPGGLVGVFIAGGAAFVMGPQVVLPVFVGATVAGQIAINSRRLRVDERTFATRIFNDKLPLDKILITNMLGAGHRPFVCPNPDGDVLMNLGDAAFDRPIDFKNEGYPIEGQLFVHELVHVWQNENSRLPNQFLWDVLVDHLATGGDYKYGPPTLPWSEAFGLEAQASVVDEWYAGVWNKARPDRTTKRGREDINDPYFRYIHENIRLGLP